MRVVLTNFGSAGDIHPFIALGVELARHGHRPVLASSPDFSAWAARAGIEFIPLGPDRRKDIEEGIAFTLASPEKAFSFESMYLEGSQKIKALPEVYAGLNDLCRNADVLISGPVQPAGRMVHEMTGIPFVSIHYLFVVGSRTNMGEKGTPAFQRASSLLINPFREQLGLKPLADPLTADAISDQLTLFAISRHVHPPPADWPEHFHMTGYFFSDEEGWEADAELEEFIEAGEKPVVITFGSMAHKEPEKVTDLLLEAVRLSGYRAIIQRGWSGLAKRDLPKDVLAVEFVPHHWLFPKASCVVHHGGAGTTASLFRAGVPGVFVPHLFDHPIWSAFAQELGCAGSWINYQDLTPERLAMAIAMTVNTPRYYQAAARLSQKIKAENGVETARLLIEDLLS